MRTGIRVTAAIAAAVVLAGSVPGTVCAGSGITGEAAYAGCGHHGKTGACAGYAACWQDGVCLEDGSCDVDGVCQYGGELHGI